MNSTTGAGLSTRRRPRGRDYPYNLGTHLNAEIGIAAADVGAARVATASRGRSASRARAFLLLTWIASAAYVLPFVDRGWIAHDEGTLAQSADRVMRGEVPHRDFDEGYTGGLSYLHAFAFRLFGTNLRALRFVLLAGFLAFVPVVYSLARRALSPSVSALVTLACVAWTVPNYFASMPSWYNLFLAIFGAYAVFRHIETGRLWWLFAAGLCAGLSILVKVVGLYDVAAVLLFLAWRERTLAAGAGADAGRRSVAFAVIQTVLAAMFVLMLAMTFRTRQEPADVIHFVLPGAAVAWTLVAAEWREGQGRLVDRLRRSLRLAGPFLAGVAIPVAAFVFAYARAGGLDGLREGLIARPQRQIVTAVLRFPEVSMVLPVVPYAALLVFPAWLAARRRGAAATVLGAALLALLWAGSTGEGYRFIWSSIRSLDVVVVLVGCVWLAARRAELGPERSQRLFFLLSMTACIGLIQFPFSAPIYFCYAVPFTILAIAFLVEAQPERIGWAHVQVLVFATAFAVVYLHPGYIYFLGGAPLRYTADGRLSIERGGLRIDASEAKAYTELVEAVAEKARGTQIYAGPESPEVYFLCAKPNLTRIFFEGVSGVTVKGDTATLARVFEREDVKVIVWNRHPEFTHGLWRVYRERLWQRFPHSREIGHFTLMWRD